MDRNTSLLGTIALMCAMALTLPFAQAQSASTPPATSNPKVKAQAAQVQDASPSDQATSTFNSITLPQIGMTDGGENGGGVVVLNGTQIDANKLAPGASKAKADQLQTLSTSGGSLDTLHTATNAQMAANATDTSFNGDALVTAQRSAKPQIDQSKQLQQDNAFWANSLNAISQAQAGNSSGAPASGCTTSTSASPTTTTSYTVDEKVCDVIQSPSNSPVCERSYQWQPGAGAQHLTMNSPLNVGEGATGNVCLRQVTATPSTAAIPESTIAPLQFPNETGGGICARTRWPVEADTWTPEQTTSNVSVNEDVRGGMCTRQRTVTVDSTAVTGSQDAALDLDPTTGGNMCTRTRVPTATTTSVDATQSSTLNIKAIPPPTVSGSDWQWPSQGMSLLAVVTQDATLAVDPGVAGTMCTVKVVPKATSNAVPGDFSADLGVDTESNHNVCSRQIEPTQTTVEAPGSQSATLGVDTEVGGKVCTRSRSPSWKTTSVPGTASATLASFPVGADGTIETLQRWVTQQAVAPPPVMSSPVTQTAQTGFSYDPTATRTGSVSIDLSGIVPPGATSISGFDVTPTCFEEFTGQFSLHRNWPLNCSGDPSGLAVSTIVTQMPTAANHWVGTIKWTDSNPSPPANTVYEVQLNAAWSVPAYSSEPGGTYTAPAVTAPGVGSSGSVTLNLAGAVGSSVNSISDLSFVVTCLQGSTPCGITKYPLMTSGYPIIYSATVTQQPTLSNHWQAIVAYAPLSTCATCTGSAAITVSAHWVVTNAENTSFSVVTTPGTTQPGASAACSTKFACNQSAPATVNGVALTAAMLSGVPAMYPGAAAACLAATETQTCTGSSSVTTKIDVSSYLPANTASISGFAFKVVNPQAGVSVALSVAPSLANNWTASFVVTKSGWGTATVAPQLALSWTAAQQTVTWAVDDTGNCSTAGTAECGVSWACTQSPPATINGVPVTDAMVSSLPALFTGASATCLAGDLTKACSGSAATTTSVSIAAAIPAGTKAVDNFSFVVTNPQSGVSVALVTAPSSANKWIATFATTRSVWNSVPNAPQISITWGVPTVKTTATVQDTGSCSDPGTAQCPSAWSCATNAPTTINGLPVSAALAATFAPLYPGASGSCAIGHLNDVCSGTAVQATPVSIASVLPAGTTTLTNFSFVVANPQTGVSVTLTDKPTSANSWTATFTVKRTNWTISPAAPHILMDWTNNVVGETGSVATSGNCTESSGSVCTSGWTCTVQAPTTVGGLPVDASLTAQFAPLYTDAPSTCAAAKMANTCVGGAPLQSKISIAGEIPPGITAIKTFAFTVTNPQPDVSVTLTQTPSLANAWTAIFTTKRTGWSTTAVPASVHMSWDDGQPAVSFTIQSSGNITDPGTAACPTAWSCTQQAPVTVNGILVTAGMLSTQPVLYPGAATTCTNANLTSTCTAPVVADTSVSIASQIPAGAVSISNFYFQVANPQPGIAIALVQTPAASNSWVAKYTVTRERWATSGVRPDVTMYWQTQTSTYSFTTSDAGNCNATGTANCPVAWSCTTAPPATINNIPVTAAMVAGQPPLFTGDTVECLVGSLSQSCSGSLTTTTKVSIASDIPDGTTSISNFAYAVSNAQSGVVVSLATAPNAANGWIATFHVAQTTWGGGLAKPQVHLSWTVSPATYTWSSVDQGNCSDPGDAVCTTAWTCGSRAPATINGVAVTAAMLAAVAPLYPNAVSSCITGTLSATCAGSAVTTSTIDVSSQIPAGTIAIRDVALKVNNPQAGISVSLVTAPSAANSWVATVQTTRTSFASAPAAPSVTVSFQAETRVVDMSVKDTGDCSGVGSDTCPLVWTCSEKAPITVNGIAITAPMATNQPPLYPQSSPLCVEASLASTCSGTATATTSVSIAGKIPAGVTTISSFAWSVQNPQTGVRVTLTQTPAAANKWLAIFSVTRTYAATAGGMSAPVVSLTWNAAGSGVSLSTTDTGSCSTTSTASCAVKWGCTKDAPATIDGVSVTSAMLRSAGIQLFPADTNSICVDASLTSTCHGNGLTLTQVSIASQIPSGVTSISGFSWKVATPVTGVQAALQSEPTAANGWVATFQTTRTEWTAEPTARPEVTLTWTVGSGSGNGTGSGGLIAVDSGNCSITGDAYCSTQWMCTAYASSTPTSGGTSETDVPGSTPESMTGNPGGTIVNESIGNLLPTGAASLLNVVWTPAATGGHGPPGGGGGCGGSNGDNVGQGPILPCAVQVPMAVLSGTATLTTLPSLANNWTATFAVTSPCTDGLCTPATGTLSWTAVVPGSAGTIAPGTITIGDLSGVTPLYPGAPANCIAAQKVYQCSTVNNGTVCHTDASGNQVCDSVVGGQFDGCASLKADPTCTYNRTVCTDGAQSVNGFCYLSNEVFDCRTPVTGSDSTITTTTTCNEPVCTTANCKATYTETTTGSQASAAHAMANLAMIEDINSDYVDANSTGTGGPGGPGGGGGIGNPVGGGVVQSVVQSRTRSARAAAQMKTQDASAGSGWTPWTDPSAGVSQPVSDPSQAGSLQPPPGWNMSGLTFFNGSEQSCMKVLGGLLNCCTKQAPVDGNIQWWQIFQSSMRSGWAGVASCSVAPNGASQAPSPGGWSNMNSSAGMQNVSQGFTSALENLTGNGVVPACQSASNQTMGNVENQFEAYADQTEIPKLAWYCDSSEEKLAIRKRLGECEYLGDYCKTSFLGSCLDKRQRYCCFNSQMTLMVRQQLNTQGVVGFGTAKNPQCGGISPAQLQQLNASSIDTSSLEGNMIEAGAVPSFTDMLNNQFLQQFTGSGSLIGNAGRQDIATRTIARVAQVQTTNAYNSINNQLEPNVPDPSTIIQPLGGPGNLTIQNATVTVTRGAFLNVVLTRTGGTGPVSVQVSDVPGSATSGIDYQLSPDPQTVSWGDGDTSTRTVRVFTYAPYPAVTTPRAFEIQLSNPTGGANIYPTGIQQITIVPQ